MAILLNGTDGFTRTTNIPSADAMTVCGWIRRQGDQNSYSTLAQVMNSGGTIGNFLGFLSNGDDIGISNYISDVTVLSAPGTGNWVFAAMTCSGSGAGLFIGYAGLATAASLSSATHTRGTFTAQRIDIGRDQFGENQLNADLAFLKIWDAVLTAQELEQERRSAWPVRWANLNSFYPLFTPSDDTIDLSGNARTLTKNGTTTQADSPPVSLWPIIWIPDWQGAIAAAASGITGTGALAAQASTVSGSGLSESLGTGALTAQTSVVSGSGLSTSTGTGALTAGSSTVVGSGMVEWVASGALSAQESVVSGSGLSSSSGTGALSAQSSTVSGSGLSESIGTGALQAQDSTISGTGAVGDNITGTGALSAQASTVSGVGVVEWVALGILSAQASTVSGSGLSSSSGTGALSAQSAVVSGSGLSSSIGTGDLQSQDSSVSGTGEIIISITGTGALQAQSSVVAGVGEVTGEGAQLSGGVIPWHTEAWRKKKYELWPLPPPAFPAEGESPQILKIEETGDGKQILSWIKTIRKRPLIPGRRLIYKPQHKPDRLPIASPLRTPSVKERLKINIAESEFVNNPLLVNEEVKRRRRRMEEEDLIVALVMQDAL